MSGASDEKEDTSSPQLEEVSQVKVSDDVRSLLTSASWQENRKNKMQQSDKNDTVDAVDTIDDIVETNVEVNDYIMNSINLDKHHSRIVYSDNHKFVLFLL